MSARPQTVEPLTWGFGPGRPPEHVVDRRNARCRDALDRLRISRPTLDRPPGFREPINALRALLDLDFEIESGDARQLATFLDRLITILGAFLPSSPLYVELSIEKPGIAGLLEREIIPVYHAAWETSREIGDSDRQAFKEWDGSEPLPEARQPNDDERQRTWDVRSAADDAWEKLVHLFNALNPGRPNLTTVKVIPDDSLCEDFEAAFWTDSPLDYGDDGEAETDALAKSSSVKAPDERRGDAADCDDSDPDPLDGAVADPTRPEGWPKQPFELRDDQHIDDTRLADDRYWLVAGKISTKFSLSDSTMRYWKKQGDVRWKWENLGHHSYFLPDLLRRCPKNAKLATYIAKLND